MPTYYHFKDALAVGNVEVIVSANNILSNLHEYYPLLKIGEITLGNDKDSDLIYYPGNFDVEVAIRTETDSLNNGYYWSKAFNGLSQFGNTVELLIDGVIAWIGYVNKPSVTANQIAKTIKFNCIDQSQKFKEFNPTTNPFSYDLDSWHTIKSFINTIFTSSVVNVTPFIQSTQYHGTIQARYGSPEIIYNFDDFYALSSFYYSPAINYKTVLDLAKNILINYDLIGNFGMDRILHLLPRVYQGQSTYNISEIDLLNDPELEMSYAIKGLQAKLWTGGNPGGGVRTDFYFSTVNYGDVTEINDKEQVEKIQIDQPGGEFPIAPDNSTAFSGVAVPYTDNFLHFVDTNQNFRRKLTPTTYSDWTDLWKIPVEGTWIYASTNRPILKVEVSGVWDKWNFNKYYTLLNDANVFRPAKIKYNLYKKRSTMTLKKAN